MTETIATTEAENTIGGFPHEDLDPELLRLLLEQNDNAQKWPESALPVNDTMDTFIESENAANKKTEKIQARATNFAKELRNLIFRPNAVIQCRYRPDGEDDVNIAQKMIDSFSLSPTVRRFLPDRIKNTAIRVKQGIEALLNPDSSILQEERVRTFFELTKKLGNSLYRDFKDAPPSKEEFFAELKNGIAIIEDVMHIRLDINDEDLEKYSEKLMRKLWPKPIAPYIKTMLLRESTIKKLDLLRLWKNESTTMKYEVDGQRDFADISEELAELDKETSTNKAVEDLAEKAEKANALLVKLSTDSFELHPEIAETNDIRELQEIIRNEPGFTKESWEKKHGAYLKISLMYGVCVMDGNTDHEKIRQTSQILEKRFKQKCIPYQYDENGEPSSYILNPTPDGKIGFDSLVINGYSFNEKEEDSRVLKFVSKVLSDSMAPDVRGIRDDVRFREELLEDCRKAHPLFAQMTRDEAQKAAAIKALGINHAIYGTTIDRRHIRNSLTTEHAINESSAGRIHQTIQFKAFVAVDVDANGKPVKAPTTRVAEGQIKKYVDPEEYDKDVQEYITKKTNLAKALLGITDFSSYLSDLCDVFIYNYSFEEDDKERREEAANAFGFAQADSPLTKEIIAERIVRAVLVKDMATQDVIRGILANKECRLKFMKALKEIAYSPSCSQHCADWGCPSLEPNSSTDNAESALFLCQTLCEEIEIEENTCAAA